METAQQQQTEQQQRDRLRALKKDISRLDTEISNIEGELRVVLEVLRLRSMHQPAISTCHVLSIPSPSLLDCP